MTSLSSRAPRLAALRLITQVTETQRSLSELLANPPRDFANLPPEGRARAQRLATASFRHAGRADDLLRTALRKTPPEPVMWVLRLAATEIHTTSAAAHGVINDAVELTRSFANMPKLAGLVNAVLRSVATQDWAAAPAPRLPAWLRGALQNAYGAQAVLAIEAAHETPPPLDLTLKGPCPDGLVGTLLPMGSLRLAPTQVSALAGYDRGDWWVQDAAAALPAKLLGDVAGLRVLDLCAAPGGKTMQLASAGAHVTALDISAARMTRLRENLTRTGLNAELVVADALEWRAPTPFDAILLDAPCSATGTLRRHPELPWLRSKDDVRALRKLQSALLARVLAPEQGLLKPGGRVVYCTCSLLPSEGEDQIADALTRYNVALTHPRLDGLPPQWQRPDGAIRTRPDFWPQHGGIDGFYMAVLQHLG